MPPPSRIFPKVSKLRAINHPPAAKVDFRNGKPLPKQSAAPPQLAPQPYPVYPSGASGAYDPSLARRRLFPHLRDAFASFRQRCRSLPQPIQLSFRTFVLMLPAIPIGLFIHENVFRLVKVNGPSMTPYLNEDYDLMHTRADTVLVKLWSKHQWIPWKDGRRIERGMVVIFRSPANPFRLAVKRIVGLPGDRVTHRDFPENDSYLVPWNHIWVEGDAADPHRSMDSNTYGPISISLIEGVVVAVLGPRMRWLDWKSWESGDVDDAGPNGRLGPNYRQSMRNRVLKDAVKLERPPEW